MDIDIEALSLSVKRSRKYAHLCEDTIRRVARWAAPRSRSQKDAVKRTRRKLHQVYAAYLGHWDAERAQALLDQLPAGVDLVDARDVCRRIMQGHVSTRERVAALDNLYGPIVHITGTPKRVLDLGCGLHPFALPWMNLPTDVTYIAWEIDERIVRLVNRFLCRVGLEPLAQSKDMLVDEPTEAADVAFLLKMLPSLQQQEKGSGLRILRAIRAPFVVVSFPGRSIGGRDKGMKAHYPATMERALADTGWPAVRLEHAGELFFVVDKGNSASP